MINASSVKTSIYGKTALLIAVLALFVAKPSWARLQSHQTLHRVHRTTITASPSHVLALHHHEKAQTQAEASRCSTVVRRHSTAHEEYHRGKRLPRRRTLQPLICDSIALLPLFGWQSITERLNVTPAFEFNTPFLPIGRKHRIGRAPPLFSNLSV